MTTTDSTQRRPFPVLADGRHPSTWADPATPVRRSPLERWLPLLAWLGTLAVAVALLHALGGGRLAAPDLTSPATWPAWAAGRDPLEVTMVVVRLLGLALAWYLVGVTSISVLARVLRAARLVRVADALAVGPVRVIAQQAVGVGLAAGVLVSAVPPTAWPGAAVPVATETIAPLAATTAPTAVQWRGDAVTADRQPDRTVAADAADAAADVPASVPAPVPGPTAVAPSPGPSPSPSPMPSRSPVSTPSPDPSASAPEDVVTQRDPAVGPSSRLAPSEPAALTDSPPDTTSSGTEDRLVTVAPGDHFWALATDDLTASLGRVPSEDEVVVHWASVVDANRDRLVVADNPDLLVPGQQVVLPPVRETAP